MMMTTACTGSTPKASDKAKAVKGMMPNWQRKPMMMPQGFLIWPHSFSASTVQPIENMTMASITVSTVLNTRPSIALKSPGGTRQFEPEQIVATVSQALGTAVIALNMVIVDNVLGEENDPSVAPNLKGDWRRVSSELVILRFHKTTPVSPTSKKMMAKVGRTVQLTALYADPATAKKSWEGIKNKKLTHT